MLAPAASASRQSSATVGVNRRRPRSALRAGLASSTWSSFSSPDHPFLAASVKGILVTKASAATADAIKNSGASASCRHIPDVFPGRTPRPKKSRPGAQRQRSHAVPLTCCPATSSHAPQRRGPGRRGPPHGGVYLRHRVAHAREEIKRDCRDVHHSSSGRGRHHQTRGRSDHLSYVMVESKFDPTAAARSPPAVAAG